MIPLQCTATHSKPPAELLDYVTFPGLLALSSLPTSAHFLLFSLFSLLPRLMVSNDLQHRQIYQVPLILDLATRFPLQHKLGELVYTRGLRWQEIKITPLNGITSFWSDSFINEIHQRIKRERNGDYKRQMDDTLRSRCV
jgi:hypothetical protein